MLTIETQETNKQDPVYVGVSPCGPEGPVALTPEQTALITRTQEDEQLADFLSLAVSRPRTAARYLLELDDETRKDYLDIAGKLLDEPVANRFAGKYFKERAKLDGDFWHVPHEDLDTEVTEPESDFPISTKIYAFIASGLICASETAIAKIAEKADSSKLPGKIADSVKGVFQKAIEVNGPIQIGESWGVIKPEYQPDLENPSSDDPYMTTSGEQSPLGVDKVLTYRQLENGEIVATRNEVYLVNYEEALTIFGRVYGTGLFYKLIPELLFDNERLARLATEIHCAILQPLEDFGLERIKETLRNDPSFVETMDVTDKRTGESRLDTAIKRVAIADYRQGENTRTDKHWQRLIDKAGIPAKMKQATVNAVHQFVKEINKAKEKNNA